MAWIIQRLRNAWRLLGVAFSRSGTLAFSLLVGLALPSIPIGIELVNTASISYETVLLTAVILSATFLSSAEKDGYRTLYGLLAIVAVLFEVGRSPWAHNLAQVHAYKVLILVMFLHFTERVNWHIVHNRPFPERTAKEHV